MNKIIYNFFWIILIFLLISGFFALVNPKKENAPQEISFSEFARDLEEGKISAITVQSERVDIVYGAGEKSFARKEASSSIFESLGDFGVTKETLKNTTIKIGKENTSILDIIIPILGFVAPVLIFVWFFWIIFRQAKQGAGQTFGFLKAPAKIFDGKGKGEKVFFKDIAGLEEAKEEIAEVVEFLKSPKKFWKMGARIPRGVLLVGPPGVGKTMLAKAVATEAEVPFFSMVGSEFIELFVGVGASRTRSLFEEAKKHQPSIIFIDELDAIGKMRMPGFGGGHEEREQTLNQILAEMDGFEKQTGVIILAATNRPESLDPALLRPGRFDRRIVLDLPDVKGREAILIIHCQGKPLSGDVHLVEIAERTPGFSGADLANLVNEAAILATRRNKEQIFQQEFLESIEKVLRAGTEKPSSKPKREENFRLSRSRTRFDFPFFARG